MKKKAIRSLGALALIGAIFWAGVLLHEAGHVLSALIFGARLTRLNVLGLEFLPSLRWQPMPGYYGYMTYQGDLTPVQDSLVSLAGSLATFSTAVVAQLVLWLIKPRPGAGRLAVLALCFFWLDILTHTLPTLGIPAYLFFGSRTLTPAAEAYRSAVALGMPGPLFQVLAVGLSLALLALTLFRWHRLARTHSTES